MCYSEPCYKEVVVYINTLRLETRRVCEKRTCPGVKVNFFFKVGHRLRSQVKIFCMIGKPLSQGTYMPNMKALSERVQKL